MVDPCGFPRSSSDPKVRFVFTFYPLSVVSGSGSIWGTSIAKKGRHVPELTMLRDSLSQKLGVKHPMFSNFGGLNTLKLTTFVNVQLECRLCSSGGSRAKRCQNRLKSTFLLVKWWKLQEIGDWLHYMQNDRTWRIAQASSSLKVFKHQQRIDMSWAMARGLRYLWAVWWLWRHGPVGSEEKWMIYYITIISASTWSGMGHMTTCDNYFSEMSHHIHHVADKCSLKQCQTKTRDFFRDLFRPKNNQNISDQKKTRKKGSLDPSEGCPHHTIGLHL